MAVKAVPHSSEQGALPGPRIYEEEYNYWPWGRLIRFAADLVASTARNGSAVLDYMCGTGFLLNEIRRRRSDLVLSGCSLDLEYVEYGKAKYPDIPIHPEDALNYKPLIPLDVVLCTAGLHHLRRPAQAIFVRKVASELVDGGFFILGEEVVREFSSERERRKAVLEMNEALLGHLIDAEAPASMLEAAAKVLACDLTENGEFKESLNEIFNMLSKYFSIESAYHLWPESAAAYGDILLLCRRK